MGIRTEDRPEFVLRTVVLRPISATGISKWVRQLSLIEERSSDVEVIDHTKLPGKYCNSPGPEVKDMQSIVEIFEYLNPLLGA